MNRENVIIVGDDVIDECINCGKAAYKTNGKGEYICYNLAHTGSCEGNKPIIKSESEKQSRNDRCNCGSGLKFKHCHGK